MARLFPIEQRVRTGMRGEISITGADELYGCVNGVLSSVEMLCASFSLDDMHDVMFEFVDEIYRNTK